MILCVTRGKEPSSSNSHFISYEEWFKFLHNQQQEEQDGLVDVSLPPTNSEKLKCDKCPEEFCSTINYQRHLRLHRRKLNLDKEPDKNIRGLLQAFWDKQSVEEAVKICSFDDVSLEGVSGASIVKALTLYIQEPENTSMMLGCVLLKIVQGRAGSFPISSRKFFSILDSASEKTFLCSGTAETLQKFVFNGDAGKIGVETRNLLACICFLIEQKLVKAYLAFKDAEALRHQKLLEEEEEITTQKRQAVILKKKSQKKLRQKDRTAKELTNGKINDSLKEIIPSPPISNPANDHDSTRETLEIPSDATSSPNPSQSLNSEEITDTGHDNKYTDFGTPSSILAQLLNVEGFTDKDHDNKYQDSSASDHDSTREMLEVPFVATPFPRPSQLVNVERDTEKNQENRHPDFGARQKGYRDLGASPKPAASQKRAPLRSSNISANNTEVWKPKPKSESRQGRCKTSLVVDEPKPPCHEIQLLIGSIPVPLGNSVIHGQDGNLPICEVESTYGCEDESDSCLEAQHQGGLIFSTHVAQAFLSQRWKEAIMADHDELDLLHEQPPRNSEAQGVHNKADLSTKENECSVLHNTEDLLSVTTATDSSAAIKPKAKRKSRKGRKMQDPNQSNAA